MVRQFILILFIHFGRGDLQYSILGRENLQYPANFLLILRFGLDLLRKPLFKYALFCTEIREND